MFDLPKPQLGNISAITISSPDLEKSLQYYQKLGFAEVMRFDFPFPWIQISDEALLIMLRLDDTPYIALTYYVKEFDQIVTSLEEKGISFIKKPIPSDMLKRALFQSPDGMNISLVMIVDGFKRPAGQTMLTMNQEDYFKPDTYTNKVCGMFGELAHPVKNLGDSITFWQKLGFSVLSKFESPYPWAIISDGLSIVGLHQTKDFNFPAITFFASDMKERINKLKTDGLSDFKERGGSGNVVLTTPEQQHIFLFSLGF